MFNTAHTEMPWDLLIRKRIASGCAQYHTEYTVGMANQVPVGKLAPCRVSVEIESILRSRCKVSPDLFEYQMQELIGPDLPTIEASEAAKTMAAIAGIIIPVVRGCDNDLACGICEIGPAVDEALGQFSYILILAWSTMDNDYDRRIE